MEYFSSNKFIPKLETKNFLIGSFDVYLDKVKETITSYLKLLETLDYNSVDDLLSLLPTAHRASIVSKENGEYVGFISTIDVDNQRSTASIHFETCRKLAFKDVDDILNTYEEYLNNSLFITKIKDLVVFNKNAVRIEEGENSKQDINIIDDPNFELRNIY